MPKKVCLLGSAPSSLPLAPHDDASWELWGCSPGAKQGIGDKRVDVWFEMHRILKDFPWFKDDDPYWKFLKEFKGTVWMLEPHPEIPNSRRYPIEHMLDKYGPFFWQSSLSYMAAMALEDAELEILGWRGIDMAAVEEYAQQKPACQFFIQKAMERGVVIDIPPESDLFYPQQMYGYSEVNPHRIKLDKRTEELAHRINTCNADMEHTRKEYWACYGALHGYPQGQGTLEPGSERHAELTKRLQQLAIDIETKRDELMFIKGAYDDNTYHKQTYVQHPYAIGVLGRWQAENADKLRWKQATGHGEGTEGTAVRGPAEGHAEQGNGSAQGSDHSSGNGSGIERRGKRRTRRVSEVSREGRQKGNGGAIGPGASAASGR